MKTIIKFILALTFSGSAFAGDLDELISKVCLSPSQAGKYWNIEADGKAGANGTIRLFSAGINGEATFTKGEWEGVQQVLKSHQASDNDSFRKCSMALTPLLLPKFATAPPKSKSIKSTKTKPVTKNKATALLPSAAAENNKDTQTVGNITNSQVVIQQENKGDTNINFGNKP